jgi:hypothetical protein
MSDTLFSIVGLGLPLIAQITSITDADRNSATIWWIFGLAGAAVAFNQIAAAWTRLTGRSDRRSLEQPVEIREAKEPAPRNHEHNQYQEWRACQNLHRDLNATLERMDTVQSAQTDTLRREIKDDFKGVHSRVDAVLGELRDLGGQFKVAIKLFQGGPHAD